MQPWILLDHAAIPGGRDLRLMRRGSDHSIMVDRIELMSSRQSGSEQALATLCCERIAAHADPRVLIGGLGMGFTLRAALACLPPAARITVAELVPELLTWAAGPLAELFGSSLSDPRVRVEIGDVGAMIWSGEATYDAILLDVDNGPASLTNPENARLYGQAGLAAARRALRPGGVLAVWSAFRDDEFTRRLQQAGFAVDLRPVRARGTRGARHVIWLATRAIGAPAGRSSSRTRPC